MSTFDTDFFSASHLKSLTNRTRVKLDHNAAHPGLAVFILLRFHPTQRGNSSHNAWQVFGKVLVSLGGKLSLGSSEQHCHWDALPGTGDFLSAHVIPRSLIKPWDSSINKWPFSGQ